MLRNTLEKLYWLGGVGGVEVSNDAMTLCVAVSCDCPNLIHVAFQIVVVLLEPLDHSMQLTVAQRLRVSRHAGLLLQPRQTYRQGRDLMLACRLRLTNTHTHTHISPPPPPLPL